MLFLQLCLYWKKTLWKAFWCVAEKTVLGFILLEYFSRCCSFSCVCTGKKLFEGQSKRKQETKGGLWKSYRPKHTNTHPALHTHPHCFWPYSIGVFCKMLLNQLFFHMERNFLKGSQRENKKQKIMVGGNLTVPHPQIHPQPSIPHPHTFRL
jgi:hypothetical protein